MRVLLFARSLPFHTPGGMEMIAWDTARSLAKRDIEVHMLTTQCRTLNPLSTVDGVSIDCVDAPSGRYSRDWWRRSSERYQQHYRDKVDIVLSVSAGAMSAARDRALGSKPFFIAQMHGTTWGQMQSKFREAQLLSLAKGLAYSGAFLFDRGYRYFDGFTTVGSEVSAQLAFLQKVGLLTHRPFVEIPNGVDKEAFAFRAADRDRVRRELGLSDDERVVISTSRLHKQKGIREGLQAFAIAARQRRDLRFLVVGSGPYGETAARLASQMGIASQVVFLGAADRANLPAFLSAADVFLFPTLHNEGSPLSLLEALASGLPCVVSRHISIPGQTNLIKINPANPNEGASAILAEALRPPGSRQSSLGERYWLTTMVSRYVALFDSFAAALA